MRDNQGTGKGQARDKEKTVKAVKTLKEKKINSLAAAPLPSAVSSIQQVKKAAFEETSNRSVFNKRHDEHILKWIGQLGLEAVIRTIRDTDFKSIDYFYTEVDEEICCWEKMFLDSQLSRYEELKEGEYQKVNPTLREIFTKPKAVWNKDEELRKLQDRFGIRSPEARDFAMKWGMSI